MACTLCNFLTREMATGHQWPNLLAVARHAGIFPAFQNKARLAALVPEHDIFPFISGAGSGKSPRQTVPFALRQNGRTIAGGILDHDFSEPGTVIADRDRLLWGTRFFPCPDAFLLCFAPGIPRRTDTAMGIPVAAEKPCRASGAATQHEDNEKQEGENP